MVRTFPQPAMPLRIEIRDLCRCGYTVAELKELAPSWGLDPGVVEGEALIWITGETP
jgi:hypothetical protein